MTIQEFSDGFDTLVNSYSINASFGESISKRDLAFDEYEKSQFLTIAQEEMVVNLYTGNNPQGDSFESSEEIRRYLANLVVDKNLKPITNTSGTPLGLSTASKFFTLPDNPKIWFTIYESVIVDNGKCGDSTTMKVYPVRHDEYQNIKDNPFRGANDRRALRLDLSEGNVEIVCKYNVTDYYIRYIKRLTPIVLVDLPDGLTINEESKATDCELHEALHYKILERAVILALQSKGISLNKETRDN